jgi:hypothetical protein
MSEMINHEPVHVPAAFPSAGRWPINFKEVLENYDRQLAEYRVWRGKMAALGGAEGIDTCADSLHISLFFDGTGNNEHYDTKIAQPPHPTNMARLYHASLEAADDGYFSYYIPGVGTPFPEIGELDFTFLGLAVGNGGENRINWGLLRIADALLYTLNKKQRLDLAVALVHLKAMATTWPFTHRGKSSRRKAMEAVLEPVRAKVKTARPKVLALKLYVYGFSRGAAEARTFINWLSELFDTPAGAELPEQSLLGIPLSIEFLGLLDTVASVGSARMIPLTEGHMDWAEGTQPLPDSARFPGWIKSCQHFVAAHEQRLSFPLESIRGADGHYPSYAKEVVYPGVHSDIGGGYPPGDQGKSTEKGELLSQVVLHDLYAAAYAVGAPLTVREDVLSGEIRSIKPSRVMPPNVVSEFGLSASLPARFNAWRTTLSLPAPDTTQPETAHEPLCLAHDLEHVLSDQLALLTGWRVGRFVDGSYIKQPFYMHARQTSPAQQKLEEQEHQKRSEVIKLQRLKAAGPNKPSTAGTSLAGLPSYAPVKDQQQLREAADEFVTDYLNKRRYPTSAAGIILETGAKRNRVYLISQDQEHVEAARLRGSGKRYAHKLFPQSAPANDRHRLGPWAQRDAVIAFFDDYVHDSRAWFMRSAIGTRELWGDYLRYRTVFCGDYCNKRLTLVQIAGVVLGIDPVPGVRYGIRLDNWQDFLEKLPAGKFGYKVIDLDTGEVVPFLPDAARVLQPTHTINAVAEEQGRVVMAAQNAQRTRILMAEIERQRGLSNPATESLS